MTLTFQALQSARRNLMQQIDKVIPYLRTRTLDPWVGVKHLRSIEHHQHRRCLESEVEATRPPIWTKKEGAPATASALAQLKAPVAAVAVPEA